jgi:hypothetical protein
VEPGSPFVGESQPGQAPLHRIRHGLMPPPPIKSGQGGFKCLSQAIPSGKTRTVRCQPTQRGMKEIAQLGLRYKAWGYQVPSMGPQMRQMLATLCVTSSLTLGGSDRLVGFTLEP